MRDLLLILIFSPALSLAAPYPATSSSAFTAPEKGLYFLHKGFTLKTAGTDWIPHSETEQSLLGTVRFTGANNLGKGSLSVRTDRIAKAASLELYTRRWMRDYPNYGFEVISAKNFELNGSPALVVDMLSRTKDKQIRQVVLKKDSQVAILTCLDDKSTFGKSLESCNRIIKSFEWTKEETKTP